MGIAELFILSVGVGMDAFAVAACKGLSMPKMSWKKACIIGLYFGVFQAIMPIIGYILGIGFESKVRTIGHWIAFLLLSIIGIKMITEAVTGCGEDSNDDIKFKTMIVLALATSVDALAVGISLAFINVNIISAVIAIGVITFILSIWGVKIGNLFGNKCEKKTEIIGGAILILIGIKILLEHLGILF